METYSQRNGAAAAAATTLHRVKTYEFRHISPVEIGEHKQVSEHRESHTTEMPTFLPRHVQQPARERCDRRVALLEPAEVEDEVEVAVKPDGRKCVEEEESSLSVRGARGGR